MVRGFYSVAAGVFNQQKSFNMISNNIANASTAGFKNQGTIDSSFGDHLVSRMSSIKNLAESNIGKGSFMTVNNSHYTDFTQGAMENTGRSVDLAIQGEGFFLVKTESNGELLTRNGQFELDKEGYLTLSGVGKVLNESKNPIKISNIDFAVDSSGSITVDGKVEETLFVASKGDGEKLKSAGNGGFKSENEAVKEDGKNYAVMQGALEKSNMNISEEMSKIIAGQNRYQSCTQILKIYDRINEITVNQIGRIG